MYKLKENKLLLLAKSNLSSNYTIEFEEGKNIKFSRESIAQSRHRTQVNVKINFKFLNKKLGYHLDDELLNLILEENGLNQYFKINLKISIEAENTVFQNVILKKREYVRSDDEAIHKGLHIALTLSLYNCRFDILRVALRSSPSSIKLSHVKCIEFNCEGNLEKIEMNNIFGKIYSVSPINIHSISLDKFSFEKFAVSKKLRKVNISNGVIKEEIVVLEDKNEGFPNFNVSFVNLKNATRTKIDTIRKIKKQLEQVGNTYDYLNVRACEYKITIRELSFRKKPLDFIQLGLNEISNNYGTSWLRGFMVTFLINFLGSLALYYSMFRNVNISDTVDKLKIIFFNNFSPIYRNDFLEENNASILSYTILLFTKIFVFYGIYQTVAAFRKYRR